MVMELTIEIDPGLVSIPRPAASFLTLDLDKKEDAEFFKEEFGETIYQHLLEMGPGGELDFFINRRD